MKKSKKILICITVVVAAAATVVGSCVSRAGWNSSASGDYNNSITGNAIPLLDESLQKYDANTAGAGNTDIGEGMELSGTAETSDAAQTPDADAEPATDQEEDDSAPYVPDSMTESMSRIIIGGDDRISVDSRMFPYSAIANMYMHYTCGCTASGSGFMVKDNILLTAAHCVSCVEHRKPADTIDFYFGYKPDGSYLYYYEGEFTYYYGTYFEGGYTSENVKWDYAIVKFLNDDVGQTTGYFGIRSGLRGYDINGEAFEVAGYRDGSLMASYGEAGAYDSGEPEDAVPLLFKHYADTVKGYSGGPVFDDGGYAVGINVAESEQAARNVARTIDSDVYSLIQELSMPSQEIDSGSDSMSAYEVSLRVSDPDAYICPFSSERILTNGDIQNMTQMQRDLARNEIYARHGRIFKEAEFRDYFNSKNWYNGYIAPEDFKESMLSDIERKNAVFIRDYKG